MSLPGDLIYLNAVGQPVVVINSSKVGVALLDRRAAIYSDRPRFIVASDIMTGGLFFGLSRYGDAWVLRHSDSMYCTVSIEIKQL